MWFLLSGINILLAYQAEKNFAKNKAICKVWLFNIVIINSIIIGLRDIGVGADTLSYIEAYFNAAYLISDFHSLLYFAYEGYDKGFLVLAWVATQWADDPRCLMFITELFIVVFIVLGVYEYKKTLNTNITLFMLLFCLLYQQESVNLMRQFCAMSILFYGYSLFLQKRIKTYCILQVLAYFLHTTSVLFVIVPLFYTLSHTTGIMKYYFLAGSSVLIILFITFYLSFLGSISDLGIFQEVYAERYGKNSIYEGSERASFATYLTFIVELFVYYNINKYKIESQSYRYMFLSLFCVNFLLGLTTMASAFFFRLAYYIGIVFIVYFPIVLKARKTNVNYLFYICVALFFIKMVKDIYLKELYGEENHLSYTSQILGIK